jgi:hypothetical protein
MDVADRRVRKRVSELVGVDMAVEVDLGARLVRVRPALRLGVARRVAGHRPVERRDPEVGVRRPRHDAGQHQRDDEAQQRACPAAPCPR